MNRKSRVLFSLAGLVAAGLIAVLGVVMSANASFAKTYVADQLGQQRITFQLLASLTAEEKASPCLVRYAG